MDFGEALSGIDVFQGVSSEFAFICPSGHFGVFNTEVNEITISKRHNKPLNSIATDAQHNIYYADDRFVYMHDPRTNGKEEFVLQCPSDIVAISASGSTLAASTKDRGIILSDCRALEINDNSENTQLILKASSISFNNLYLLAGYQNSRVVVWETVSKDNTEYSLPANLDMHCLEALSVFFCNDNPVVCYSSGITVYKNQIPNYTTLSKTSLFSCASASLCYGNDHCAIGMNDGTISILNTETMQEVSSKQYGREPISHISGNSLMVVALFEDDLGSFTIITPDDFDL